MLAIFPLFHFCKVFSHSRQDVRPTQLHPLISNSSVTTKLQDEKRLHRLGSLTDETAKNRFSAIPHTLSLPFQEQKNDIHKTSQQVFSIYIHQQEMLLYFTSQGSTHVVSFVSFCVMVILCHF